MTRRSTPVSTLRSVCAECGIVYERETTRAKCPTCKPDPRARSAESILTEAARGTAAQRGYDAAWERLSRRARRLQPFCSDCGRTDTLTTDHSPQAWERRARGLAVRLEDVDVVCRQCNTERGAARGPDAVDRPTIGSARDDLARLTDEQPDDLDADAPGLDERIARGWTQGE